MGEGLVDSAAVGTIISGTGNAAIQPYTGQEVGAALDTGAADSASTGADQAAQVKQNTALS